jgi:NAD(P)-dependent dehydrogenase (short-subunit alcohol dehydrogenase family)
MAVMEPIHKEDTMAVALITGGSAGLGLALTRALAQQGWTVLVDGRDAGRLRSATADIEGEVITLPGNVGDPAHRRDLVAEVERLGQLDLLVHNASSLGPVPLRPLVELEPEDLRAVWAINVDAPISLTRDLLPHLTAHHGVLLSISSDAAIEHYEGWGPYGASKAALDHLVLTLAAETGVTAYAVDPGDMLTRMHQDAFLGEDISDRPLPETVVPHLLGLLAQRPASGRLKAVDIPPAAELPVARGA